MEQMVSFTNEENTLRGILHLPDNGPADHPAIILCHGFMGNKIGLHRVLVKAARVFYAKGYTVLRLSLEWEDKVFHITAAWMDQNTH